MSRTLAMRVERLEALLELVRAKASGGGIVGGSAPVLGVIYRQGGVTAGNVLATWAEVETAVANARGVLRVYVDSSITSPSLVQTGHATDCLGNVELWPYRKVGAVRDTLLIKDGSSLHRLRGVFGPLTLQVENVTTAGLTFAANEDELTVRGDSPAANAIIEGLPGATLPVIDLHAAVSAIIVEATFASLESDQAGVPFFGLGTVSDAIVIASLVVYEGLVVTGGAGSVLEIINLDTSTTFPLPSQVAGFTGALLQAIEAQAPGTSGYDAPWFAAGTIFVDPAAGSDGNAGTTAGAPLKTYAEAVRRWGSTSPTLSVDTQIKFLSNHVDDSDPVSWSPTMLNGAIPSIIGAIATTAANFTRSAAKNRAAGANSALAGSFSAGAPAAGVLVHNTTAGKDSRAFIYKTAGGANWTLCQPLVTQAIPQAAIPAEVDTWATADTLQLLALTAVNLVDFSPTIIDYNGGFDDLGYLQAIQVFDPGGLNLSPVYIGTNVYCADVAFQRAIYASSVSASILTAQGFGPPVFSNCFFGGGLNWIGVSSALIYGGCWPANGGTALRLVGHSMQPSATQTNLTVDGDFITGGAAFFSNVQIGFLFLDGNLTCTGTMIYDSGPAGGHVIYGTAAKTMSLRTACRGLLNGTFTAGWTAPTLVTGVTMDGATTASSIAYAGNVGTIHNGITTSVANLDAAAGAAGFGGSAFNLGGSSVSNLVG